MNLGAVGERVRVLRTEKRWTQAELAKKAKVSAGTVQALEDAVNRQKPRQTSPEKLQAIAKALGHDVEDLIKDRSVVQPTNPLLKGLNDEHLEVARWYMQARKRTRELIDALMARGDDARLTNIFLRVEQLPPESWPDLEDWIATMKEPGAPGVRPTDESKIHDARRRNR